MLELAECASVRSENKTANHAFTEPAEQIWYRRWKCLQAHKKSIGLDRFIFLVDEITASARNMGSVISDVISEVATKITAF